MEEKEDIKNWGEEKIRKRIKLAQFRIGKMYEPQKAEADEERKAMDKALLLEEQNLELLKDELDRRKWAKAFEAGKTPNYKIDEIEQQRLLKEADAKMTKRGMEETG